VCFHGEPKPDNCTQKWVQDCWKIGGAGALNLTTLPNTSNEAVFRNIKANENRAPWLMELEAHDDIAIICGSGPSLIETIPILKSIKGRVFALNNAARVLCEHGVRPD
jgi:hypothetical protein